MKRFLRLMCALTLLWLGGYALVAHIWIPQWRRINQPSEVADDEDVQSTEAPRIRTHRGVPLSSLPKLLLHRARTRIDRVSQAAQHRRRLAQARAAEALKAMSLSELLAEADRFLEEMSGGKEERIRVHRGGIVDPSVAAWIEMVRDAEASPELRAGALRGLQSHAPDFRTAAVVESILPIMETADDHVREELCRGLAGMTLPIAVDALVNRLRWDSAATVRSTAAGSLWRASATVSVRAALEEAAKDPDLDVREWAASSLASHKK